MFSAVCGRRFDEVVMPAKTVREKPSHTALVAAFYRAMAHAEAEGTGSDHLATHFLPGLHRFLLRSRRVRRAIGRRSETLTPGIYGYVLARTAFFDDCFRTATQDGTEQIVLLGAGYDTRPYRFARTGGIPSVIELDIATTQDRKRACLARAGLEPPEGLVHAPIDFDAQSIATVLAEAGYDPAKKSLFLWEGVTYYLTPDAVDGVLRLVRLNAHAETRIAFDYAITLTDENIDGMYGARTFTETWRKRRKGEPFRFFIDQGTVSAFLAQRGLELIEHHDDQAIEQTYLTRLVGSARGHVTGFFRFAVAGKRTSP